MTELTCQRLELAPHRLPGVLVTFCGVDGSGKSSLIGGLEAACRSAGVASTRTATPTSRIRKDPVFRALVADPQGSSELGRRSGARVSVLGILLSIMGDLAQHTTDTILPALERGDVVLCDRYVYTSHAEILARSNSSETEPVLACIAKTLIRPDLAFGLNVSLETSRRRVLARNDDADSPAPEEFLARQVLAYRDAADANGLITLDTEQEYELTYARALGLLVTCCDRRGLWRRSSAEATR